jgi:hypothetical protein
MLEQKFKSAAEFELASKYLNSVEVENFYYENFGDEYLIKIDFSNEVNDEGTYNKKGIRSELRRIAGLPNSIKASVALRHFIPDEYKVIFENRAVILADFREYIGNKSDRSEVFQDFKEYIGEVLHFGKNDCETDALIAAFEDKDGMVRDPSNEELDEMWAIVDDYWDFYSKKDRNFNVLCNSEDEQEIYGKMIAEEELKDYVEVTIKVDRKTVERWMNLIRRADLLVNEDGICSDEEKRMELLDCAECEWKDNGVFDHEAIMEAAAEVLNNDWRSV